MRPGGGKAKGNSFEREICKDLSLWLTNGKDERICWRSSSSGGTASVYKKPGAFKSSQSGDIAQIVPKGTYPTVDSFFETFVVECKFYAEIDLYLPMTKVVNSFFEQVAREMRESGKEGILIMKANHKKELLFSTLHFNIFPSIIIPYRVSVKTLTEDFKTEEIKFYGALLRDVVSAPLMELPKKQITKEL